MIKDAYKYSELTSKIIGWQKVINRISSS